MRNPRYPACIMRIGLASLALLLALLAPPANAEIRAVVVGVSDYLTLDADLKGPSNDARLMAETLIARGVTPTRITVLTSDPAGLPAGTVTGQPTRAAILSALAAAAAASRNTPALTTPDSDDIQLIGCAKYLQAAGECG